MRRGKSIVVVIGLILTLPACMGGAMESASQADARVAQTAPPSSTPTLQVYSRETVLDVTVTDARGRPVHGLKRSDFIVREDGNPQPIQSFREFDRKNPPASRTLPKLPPNVYSNLQPAPQASALNIILLDVPAAGRSWADGVRSRREIAKYLRSLPAGTQVALFDGMRLLHGFTSNPELLIAAMNDRKNIPLPYVDLGLRNGSDLDALCEVAAFVSGYRGRKNLIWFTLGIPQIVDPEFRGLDTPDYTSDLHTTYNALAAAQVAVYPVDAHGLNNFAAPSAVTPPGPTDEHTGAATAAALLVAYRDNAGILLSLEAVAEATGGKAFYNTNGLSEAIAKAIDDGSNYYTLSYVPPSVQNDGRFHAIHVELDSPGVHLLYRNGYFAEAAPAKAVAVAKAADPSLPPLDFLTPDQSRAAPNPPRARPNPMSRFMAYLAPPATQLLFDVKVTPTPARPADPPDASDVSILGVLDPRLTNQPLVRYDFLFDLRVAQITFVDGPNGSHSGSVQFDLIARDDIGNLITSLSKTVKMPFSDERYRELLAGMPLQFLDQLDLPPGETLLRMGIRDEASEKVGTLEITLLVPRPSPSPGGNKSL